MRDDLVLRYIKTLRYHFGDPLDDLRRYNYDMFGFVHLKDAPKGKDYHGSWYLGKGDGLVLQAAEIIQTPATVHMTKDPLS